MLNRNATGRNYKSINLRNHKFIEVSTLRVWCTLILTIRRYHVPMPLPRVLPCYHVTRHNSWPILQQWCSKGFTTVGVNSMVAFQDAWKLYTSWKPQWKKTFIVNWEKRLEGNTSCRRIWTTRPCREEVPNRTNLVYIVHMKKLES